MWADLPIFQIERHNMATAPSKAPVKQKGWQPQALPPFPAVALKALNLMAGADTALPLLCDLIKSDTAFSSEVLKIANSPLVAFSKNVTSVLQASMLLGFRRLRSVVITVGLKSYLSGSFSPAMQACWQHSVACALIAERAAKLSSLDKDFAYTAGVMHDIGRVALAASMPKAYARIMESTPERPQDLLVAERELCGIDHCAAGRTLVSAWGLPEVFLEITSRHHELGGPGRGSSSIVPPCCLLADSLGFGLVPFRSPRPYSEVIAAFPEPARKAFPAEGDQLAADISQALNVLESN